MPKNLGTRLKSTHVSSKIPKPSFFDLSKLTDLEKLDRLLRDQPSPAVIDTYEQQLKELFVVEHPWLNLDPPRREQEFAAFRTQYYGASQGWEMGVWVYLPWRHVLLHLLPDADYQRVRTARNRDLITVREQQRYYHSTIGIAGLSVGNSCALAIVLMGGGKRMRLADPDTLELTNLNRIRGSIAELTQPKVFMTARQIYELDPYANLELYPEGLTEKNITKFFDGPPRLDVVIDEIDNIGMKVRIRQEARQRGIPVVMAADNGDGGILDVERHDKQKNILPFHGRAGKNIAKRVVGKKLPLPVVGQIITEDLLGAGNITDRVQRSLLQIGSKLPTWPQLGGAAVLNGVAVAATVRRILNGQPIVGQRAMLSLESWLIPGYAGAAQKGRRRKRTKEFLRRFHRLLAGGK